MDESGVTLELADASMEILMQHLEFSSVTKYAATGT